MSRAIVVLVVMAVLAVAGVGVAVAAMGNTWQVDCGGIDGFTNRPYTSVDANGIPQRGNRIVVDADVDSARLEILRDGTWEAHQNGTALPTEDFTWRCVTTLVGKAQQFKFDPN